MTDKIENHGFIEDVVEPDQYLFGGAEIGYEELQPGGQWDAYVPPYEAQKRNGLETSNCVAYGTLNCIEAFMARKFEITANYSERYVGTIAETSPQGNSPHKVAEIIRKKSGLISEELLPFDEEINEWGEYYSPKPMEKMYTRVGKRWLNDYVFKHDWVFTPKKTVDKPARLLEALKYSPIGVSVLAWEKNNVDFYDKPAGASDGHWCMLYGYGQDERGKYWKVFDHYNESHKKLAWSYDFLYAKRYFITKNTAQPSPERKTWWFVDIFRSLFGIMIPSWR